MYFRLSLSYEVERDIWYESSQRDLRATWERPEPERLRVRALGKKGQTQIVIPWAPEGAKNCTYLLPTFNRALILLLVSFYLLIHCTRNRELPCHKLWSPHKVNNYPCAPVPRGQVMAGPVSCYCAILVSGARHSGHDVSTEESSLHPHVLKLRPDRSYNRTSRGDTTLRGASMYFVQSSQEAPWCSWHRSCLGSAHCTVLRLGTENVRDCAWCTQSAGQHAGCRVLWVATAWCYPGHWPHQWPIRGQVTPALTNQRPDIREVAPPWAGAGRAGGWPDSGAGAEISEWREPGLATLAASHRYTTDSDGQNCDQITKHRSVFGSIRTEKTTLKRRGIYWHSELAAQKFSQVS